MKIASTNGLVLALGLAALVACGASTKPGTPVAGEGTLCTSGSGCDADQSCASYSAYATAENECRTNCSAGCSNGETCNAKGIKNDAGQDDGTCQCVPGAEPGSSSDPCAAHGLVCHPDLFVCVATEPTGTACPAGETYSPLWSLCVIE